MYVTATRSTDVTTDKTLAATDCGVIQNITADALTVTLPATSVGLSFIIRNGGDNASGTPSGAVADGSCAVTISPNASDKIMGNGFTAADNKDIVNTKATSFVGDFVRLVADGVDGWYIAEISGTWARQS